MPPFLSIVTVCFNSEVTLEKTINSVLNQSFTNFEYILVDGNSKDSTLHIIQSFETRFKSRGIDYKYISEPDQGIYDAFNKGIDLSRGDWVSFLGSDDLYETNAIEVYANTIQKFKQHVDYVYSNVRVENKKLIRAPWFWNTFKVRMTIPHVGAFHNRNYFDNYGVFDERYKTAGDYDLLLRSNKSFRPFWIDKNLVFMGANGVSNQNIIKVYQETTQVKIKNKSRKRFMAQLDLILWIFKYLVKESINVFAR